MYRPKQIQEMKLKKGKTRIQKYIKKEEDYGKTWTSIK